MKRFLSIIIGLIIYISVHSQIIVYSRPYPYRVVAYSVPVRTYTIRYKYVYQEKRNIETPGWVDLRFHCDYNFNNAIRPVCNPSIEFGGSLSYYFKSKSDVSYGILAGYDNGLNQWWRYPVDNGYFVYQTNYWDIRIGACISRYFSIGMTFGEYHFDDKYMADDIGCFTNLNLPLGDHFGIFCDGKWTKYQGFSIGGGIFFNIYTK